MPRILVGSVPAPTEQRQEQSNWEHHGKELDHHPHERGELDEDPHQTSEQQEPHPPAAEPPEREPEPAHDVLPGRLVLVSCGSPKLHPGRKVRIHSDHTELEERMRLGVTVNAG